MLKGGDEAGGFVYASALAARIDVPIVGSDAEQGKDDDDKDSVSPLCPLSVCWYALVAISRAGLCNRMKPTLAYCRPVRTLLR